MVGGASSSLTSSSSILIIVIGIITCQAGGATRKRESNGYASLSSKGRLSNQHDDENNDDHHNHNFFRPLQVLNWLLWRGFRPNNCMKHFLMALFFMMCVFTFEINHWIGSDGSSLLPVIEFLNNVTWIKFCTFLILSGLRQMILAFCLHYLDSVSSYLHVALPLLLHYLPGLP